MKILVADDDALIRRLLSALLVKLGHEVQAVEDGDAALKALAGPAPPDLAILDWIMPALSGVEICKRVRAQPRKLRTYLLLLSSKGDRDDVITGLDAGADDYLIKPFDPMSLLARLRVAQRTLAYQQDLQHHISEMEALLQRHNLLGELFGKQNLRAETALKPGPARQVPTPAMLAPDGVNELLVRALAEIGLNGAAASTLDKGHQAPEAIFTAWAPLILLPDGLWVDLLLDADDGSAVAKFEAMLGRIPVSERELLDFLAETFNLLCTAIKTFLSAKGSTVFMPVISRSMRTTSFNVRPPAQAQVSRHRLALPGITLTINVVRQAAPTLYKSLGQLRELDMLAENVPSPSTKEVFLLNQGVVLSSRYIDKLVALAREEKTDLKVPVIAPSPLTEFFCLGRISGS